MNTRSDQSLGVWLVLAATVLLAMRSIIVKFAYIEGVSVSDLFFFRFVFTLPLLLSFSLWRKGRVFFTTLKQKNVALSCFIAGFFGYFLATFMDFHSLKVLDANVNRLIVYTFPIYVFLLNSLLERRLPKLMDLLIFCIVQSGLFLVLGGSGSTFAQLNKIGVILAVLSAISYSIYIIINQQIGKKIGSVLFTSYAFTFSFLLVGVNSLVFSPTALGATITRASIVYVLIMSVFCTFLPLLMISEGISRIGASRFALINTSGPVLTILFAYLFLGERMTLLQICGACTVIGFLAAYENYKRKKLLADEV